MALCASRSFARFFANWSGVRLATPRDPGVEVEVEAVRRFLAAVAFVAAGGEAAAGGMLEVVKLFGAAYCRDPGPLSIQLGFLGIKGGGYSPAANAGPD